MNDLLIKLKKQPTLNLVLQKNDPLNVRLVTYSGANAGTKIRIDTKANWDMKIAYIPANGDIIIYSDRNTIDGVNYPGLKVGDGNAYLIDLPFVGDDIALSILNELEEHIANRDIHVTEEEKNFWNNKLNCEIVEEELILNKL